MSGLEPVLKKLTVIDICVFVSLTMFESVVEIMCNGFYVPVSSSRHIDGAQ